MRIEPMQELLTEGSLRRRGVQRCGSDVVEETLCEPEHLLRDSSDGIDMDQTGPVVIALSKLEDSVVVRRPSSDREIDTSEQRVIRGADERSHDVPRLAVDEQETRLGLQVDVEVQEQRRTRVLESPWLCAGTSLGDQRSGAFAQWLQSSGVEAVDARPCRLERDPAVDRGVYEGLIQVVEVEVLVVADGVVEARGHQPCTEVETGAVQEAARDRRAGPVHASDDQWRDRDERDANRTRLASVNAAVSAGAVEFAVIVEEGVLERQALLFVESLRRFGGRHAQAKVAAISPRRSRRPTRGTVRALARLGADYVKLRVDGACPEYPTSWRVHSLAAIERLPGPPVLVQVDTDTLFAGDIGPLSPHGGALARPVDVKGMGSTGPGDPYEGYWMDLCRLAGIDIDAVGFVTTTVDGIRVRATHNGGFVAARRSAGLFSAAEELFARSVAAGLKPHAGRGYDILAGSGAVGLAGSEWWGLAQAVTSVAAAVLGIGIGALPPGVNVPVHLWHEMTERPGTVEHLHYHSLLAVPQPHPNPLLEGAVPLPAMFRQWLNERVEDVPARPRWPRRHRA